MKKTELIIVLPIVAAVLVLILFAVVRDKDNLDKVWDEPQSTDRTVQILEKTSDTEMSSYKVGADLIGTDFSDPGQVLANQLTQEWNTYDSLSKEQLLTSSHLWGIVYIQADTWDECEEAIGISVNNPLEDLDWLNKTGYFGAESVDPALPAAHVEVTANAAQGTDRKLSEINITSGYNNGSVKATLTATLCANTGPFTTVSGCNGYATYEEKTVTTKTGVPVLIVTTNETNNTGYYHGDYFDPTAYWVKENVFYTLRVFGDEADKAAIQATLERILEEI